MLGTMMRRIYLIGGLGLVGLHGWAEWNRWEQAPAAVTRMDPSVRQSPGGWRSYSFWHRGIRGGK
jgi:hypothetical protein